MKNSMLLFFALPLLSLPLAAQTVVYNFTVPPAGPGVGYAPNGNLLSYTDTANGNWTMSYDQLNRLQSAAVTTGPYQGLGLALTYDSFGNRLTQTPSGPPSTGPVLTRWANYDSSNRQTTTSGGSCLDTNGNNICYDAAGNNTFDGLNYMAYDGDNRVCAVLVNGTVTQYIYDAEGRRVAKGHSASNPSALACSMGGTDFVPTETDVLGQSGEQISQFDGSGNWQHTNVYAGGELLATYDGVGSNLHFHIADPLGSRRVQVSSTGEVELNCANLPFGDNLSCSGPGADATEHHFTGKERDAESGLDNFGARYYGSSMGRWMSPDLVNVTEERLMNPSTTLNKYAYAANNPLKYVDPDGQDITYFYDQSGAAGHAVLFAYNQATGDSAIESFGPASKSLGTRAAEVALFQVPGKSMFDMDVPKSADDLRQTYAALTIQTTPELAQQVIDYIRQNPDPATWGVLGPNCSSEVWKILRRFKLARYDVGGGKTPKIVWADLYTQYVNNSRVNVPTGGNDYGHSRCGSCMFDFLWQSLPQSHERVKSRIVPDSIKPVDDPQ